MALSKNYTTHKGVEVQYHRVNNVSFYHNQSLSCDLDSFVSQEYAVEGNQIETHSFFFENISKQDEESMGIRQLAYKKIKELELWSNALDC